MLDFLNALFLTLYFFYNTLMTFLMMPYVTLISTLMILLSTQIVIRIWFVAWHQLELVSKFEGQGGSDLLISMLEKLS